MKANSGHHALPGEGLIPIRTVSSLTGVNAVTLRAWERRHALIKPLRTPKGHRLYTMADVEMIKRVLSLLDNGMAISQVRQVLETDPVRLEPQPIAPSGIDPWLNDQQRLLRAITEFNDRALNEIYNDILALYPIDIVTNRLIVPLLRELGERWANGEGHIAEEHFFSVFLRNKLGARFHHLSRSRRGPKLLAACLPGEQHEVGLLLFTLAALDWNHQVVLLGPNTPLEELPLVAMRIAAHAITLSGSATIAASLITQQLPRLCRAVSIPVFIGGSIIEHHLDAVRAAGAIPLGDDLHLALCEIDAILSHR